MNFTRLKLNNLRPLRFAFATLMCAMLLLSSALPAAAIGASKSSPDKGAAQLNEIVDKTQELTENNAPSKKRVIRESNKGLNEVQGAAAADKMNRPSNSQDAVTVEDKVEGFLEKITGDK
ncbi:conserved hypothetical low temperature-induced protein [Calothrix parasitica NIES-267]|uniref:Conserved hypothetical low temperature-induced protein n=1 Tax=Calothrix parasitica NIES-267 TaxID=1973488 RepID=A0A1Z4LL60_9CYAN|nr:conserved hypothetical low temperature-induced protein [Calothrix parasitica NIES-267]